MLLANQQKVTANPGGPQAILNFINRFSTSMTRGNGSSQSRHIFALKTSTPDSNAVTAIDR